MTAYQRSSKPADAINRDGEPLRALQSPEVTKGLARLRRRYAKRMAPIEDVRAMLDEALGERSLTHELYRMRGCAE